MTICIVGTNVHRATLIYTVQTHHDARKLAFHIYICCIPMLGLWITKLVVCFGIDRLSYIYIVKRVIGKPPRGWEEVSDNTRFLILGFIILRLHSTH